MDINTEVGVVHDMRLGELRLYTDYGRCCRPLFIVENQQLRITKQHIRKLIEGQQGSLEDETETEAYTWKDLIFHGLIEWVRLPSSFYYFIVLIFLSFQILHTSWRRCLR